jgi:hypothetical protein
MMVDGMKVESCTSINHGLVGHWPFSGDAEDHSPTRLAGESRGLDTYADGPHGAPEGAAVFDGRSSCLEVPSHAALDFGTDDFSIAAWVHTDDGCDVVGNIAGRFDGVQARGFLLGVTTNAGVTSSVSNYRSLQFSIDSGRRDPEWIDCGRPGKAIFINSLTVHGGELYAGTTEWEEDGAGHVFRYDGEGRWIDCGNPALCNSVYATAVYNGSLYCGVARYNTRGSALPSSSNANPGGRVFRYEGGRRWADCGAIDEGDGVHCLGVFNGRLYATPMHEHGIMVYLGDGNWERIGPDARIFCLGAYGGDLYALSSGGVSIYRMERDGSWTDLEVPPGSNQNYSFAVYGGRPHIGTWPLADVFRLDPGDEWVKIGSPGYSKEVMGMAVYNGFLYAGTLPNADVYRCNGSKWSFTGTVDTTPNVTLRRAWSMAVFKGALYCGTLPSGHVMSHRSGQVASVDRPLEPGWRHLAAVKQGGRLRVWIDGAIASETGTFFPEDFDLAGETPLKIGFGPHDYFHGRISDLRIYRRALQTNEIAALAAHGH